MDDRYEAMNNVMRKIGFNIYMFMQDAGLEPEDFATKLNYSFMDVCRIIDGRVFLSPVELERIAKVLGTTKAELVCHEAEKYIHSESLYAKKFTNPHNLNMVLDLMDEYVDLVEELNENNDLDDYVEDDK